MQRDVRQRPDEMSAAPAITAAEASEAERTRYSSAGEIPAVSTDYQVSGPTASDRAFAADDARISPELAALIANATPEDVARVLERNPGLTDSIIHVVDQVHGAAFAHQAVALSTSTQHKPAVPDTPEPAAKSAAQQPALRPAPVVDAERQKHIDRSMRAGWEQIARYTTDERSTPEHIRLPKNIVSELERAWQDSVSGKQEKEQGGNIVQNSGGSYEMRRGDGFDAAKFEPDDKDVGWTQDLVAQVHTHPYRDEKDKVPEQFATFSDGDFDSLLRSDAHMSVLRSGPYTFILVKTKQFNELASRYDRDEDTLKQLGRKMSETYNAAFDATKGRFSEKCEAGVMAVCERFHLVYYVGEGADMTRKSKRPGA